MKWFLLALISIVFLPVDARGQETPVLMSQRWFGGSVGYSSMGGDFTGVSGGPLLRVIGGYSDRSGLGITMTAHGSLHPTKDRELKGMFVGHALVGPRYFIGGLHETVNMFIGAHALFSGWSIQVANPLTLENTLISAYGFGGGFSVGVASVVYPEVVMEFEVGFNAVSYNDARTEAFTLTNTSTHGKQWNVQIGFVKTWRKY